MKRVIMELWLTDEAATEMENKSLLSTEEFAGDLVGEEVLGARLTLANGDVFKVGEVPA